MLLSDLPTPTLLLNKTVLQRNIDSMIALSKKHGVTLRPHLKTSKCANIAQLFLERGVDCAAVSTLVEAKYFIDAGVRDLQYAVCISPNKFETIARLNRLGAKVSVITDSLSVAESLVTFAARTKTKFYVWLELDCGGSRTGIKPASKELLSITKVLTNSEYVELQGIMTHAGHAYGASSIEEIRTIANQEVEQSLEAKALIDENGIESGLLVSIGSTPTVLLGQDFSGVDEIRPGVFVFQDTFQWQLGVCDKSDIALSVLTTVISVDPENNRFVVDAGGLALSKDRSTALGKTDFGFGLVVDLNDGEFDQILTVYSTHQEHGLITSKQPIDFSKIRVGCMLRILPNHACMTAAAYNGYNVYEEHNNSLEFWGRVNGW